jgi:flagellar biosynthetic protein FliQ
MDVEFMRIVSDMLTTTARLSAPILIASLVIGVLVGLVQTVMQVQEATLTFVPKVVAIALILGFTGNWMLGELEDFMIRSLDSIPALLAG